MFDRIVVPLDGSENAEQALAPAEFLSQHTGAPLHLLRAIDIVDRAKYGAYGVAIDYSGMAVAVETERKLASEYLMRVAGDLRDRGVETTVQSIDGPASRVILGEARPPDLIVMATHGRTGFLRWVLGSVAEQVVRHSTVPVLLVRAQVDGKAPEATGAGEHISTG